MIYMRHPVHGTKVAVMEAEAIYDESNGWSRYTLGDAPVSDASESVNELAPRRRGRRPLNEGLTSYDDSRRPD
jgi:hypothetical protein